MGLETNSACNNATNLKWSQSVLNEGKLIKQRTVTHRRWHLKEQENDNDWYCNQQQHCNHCDTTERRQPDTKKVKNLLNHMENTIICPKTNRLALPQECSESQRTQLNFNYQQNTSRRNNSPLSAHHLFNPNIASRNITEKQIIQSPPQHRITCGTTNCCFNFFLSCCVPGNVCCGVNRWEYGTNPTWSSSELRLSDSTHQLTHHIQTHTTQI